MNQEVHFLEAVVSATSHGLDLRTLNHFWRLSEGWLSRSADFERSSQEAKTSPQKSAVRGPLEQFGV